MSEPRRRLPLHPSQRAPSPDDDPLALLRGGRFARAFAVVLGVIGLLWIVAHQVEAAAPEGGVEVIEKVHTSLRATPPKPPVEDITPDRGDTPPPKPPVEDITPGRGDPDERGVSVDRFGQKRTASGALILEDSDNSGNDEGEELGLSAQTLDTLDQGGFFDPEAFADAKVVKTKAYVHLMPGLPNEIVYVGIGLILLLSFVLFERYGKRKDPRGSGGGGSRDARPYWRFELTRARWLARAMKQRWFQPAVQLPVVLGFCAVIVAGFIGSQEPGRNIAPVLTWNIWWIGLIFLVMFAGNLWCFACPWTAIPDWVMRRSLLAVRRIRSLGRAYPRFRLWMWPAIVLFAFVTWLELAYDAANRPWLTSTLALLMVALAWLCLVLFDRKAMCRYVCFVGRVSGQYATMAMLELRRRDNETCRGCETSDCFHGREGAGYPCPTGEYMGAMNDNQYCTLCTECVKSCPHDNIALNLRSSGADLLHPHRAKLDEAYMAILVFIVSAFHGAAMIPLWKSWEAGLRGWLVDHDLLGSGAVFAGSHGGVLVFTIMMLACILAPGLLYWLLCAAMRLISGRPDVSTRKLFVRFAYTLLPIALFYHLAHNATHVFWEWSKLRRLVSDPLGWGSDFFGTARAPLSALWEPETIWYMQLALVVIGHVYGIFVAQREAFRVYDGDRKASLRVHMVMIVGMVAMSLLSLWLLAQPMYMRTADI
ncbi:4Fe-4S binding protein [Pseudenhygromyxa sp. WMMC2535]|uniref:4Fe-4S binding protein n=1 Tax=Pseudenhygromyxa sp. WMMC2535 TaxID=2712867 RepID=UPI0015537E82|nr:4Fe-4S binding protein [Pseudenhygromyxa sp. WMMC2535]NVB38804.1 4Fe-4S binding protein [Pseudenhygromyxa sp. WMMC2535]